MWLCQTLFVPSSCLLSFLCLIPLIFPSEYLNFDFSNKLTKFMVTKNTEKSMKKNLVHISMLQLTFSYSSSLCGLCSRLILLTRVKNTEGQQMLHRSCLKVFKTLSLGIDNESISGQILCPSGWEYSYEKKLIPFISNYLFKRLLGPFKPHCFLSVRHNPHLPFCLINRY